MYDIPSYDYTTAFSIHSSASGVFMFVTILSNVTTKFMFEKCHTHAHTTRDAVLVRPMEELSGDFAHDFAGTTRCPYDTFTQRSKLQHITRLGNEEHYSTT